LPYIRQPQDTEKASICAREKAKINLLFSEDRNTDSERHPSSANLGWKVKRNRKEESGLNFADEKCVVVEHGAAMHGAFIKRVIWLLAAIVMVVTIGYIDFLSDPDVGYALFYLLPIVMIAWWWGLAPAMGVALFASSTRFLVALAGRGEEMLSLIVWNSLSQWVIFTIMGYVVARLRKETNKLEKLLSDESILARTDPLTRLPNYRALEEYLIKEISRSRRNNQPLCVGYVDLDNFKRVNDHNGHGVGDECLARIGTAIKDALRPEDVVARVGGDEFAVLFSSPDPVAAEMVGQRLLDKVGLIGEDFPGTDLGASVGIVCFERPPEEPETLVRKADEIMYRAKRAGKGRLIVERIPVQTSQFL
jgi:diguanylate cyclase (GGDEF)-like protein